VLTTVCGVHVAALILLLGSACDSRTAERAEARDLLAHLNAISDDHSLVERSAALAALQRMRLQVPEHVRARDACHAAHLGLLEAETLQTSARKALASGAQQPGGSLSASDALAITNDIDRSNRALADAKASLPICERATRALLTKAH
jgi:hypothetical protein